ncbi:MAG: hypothetical protein R6U98_28715 [Pirellulaceae bacterium]
MERKQLNLVHLKRFEKDLLESLEVLFFVKDGCPKVASVQGVVKPSGFVGTWWSWRVRWCPSVRRQLLFRDSKPGD